MVDKKFENVHWADNSAQRAIDVFPNEEVYTVYSGITPSGYIHIGNFREVITTEIVRRALEDKGKKTRFLYSWDSYDAFRKVPKDVPESWSQYLRIPVGQVPNPFGEGTYGEHFISLFEQEVEPFNFPIEFQKQHELQTSGMYADSIKEILNNKHIVIEELNKYRGEDQQLDENWWPIDVYDNETKKDDTEFVRYDGEYTITYKNVGGEERQVHFKDDPRVKLRWKADWPMRWNHFKISFEPGGKDHSTPGSSYTVGKEIVKRIFNREAPVYTMYDFVKVKGQGGKISSSKGGALRAKDVLEVYTPEMVLFLFAGTRPNSEIDISFDADVIKIYEDFDKLERLYYGFEHEKNEKQRANKLRQYELSMPNGVEVQKSIPFQPSFRHLTVVAQSNDFNIEKIKEYYKNDLNTAFDENRLLQRVECAKNWLSKYAPNEFVFSIKEELGELTPKEERVVKYLEKVLPKVKGDPKDFVPYFKASKEELDLDMGEFFKEAYMALIGKEKGPKLSMFLFENKDKFMQLLQTQYSINEEKYNNIDVELSDFSKLNLQVAEIIKAQNHPESDALLVIETKLDKNEEEKRQIIFSIENGYSVDELVGKKVVILANLKPSKFKGVISEAMVIACENIDKVCGVILPDLEIGQHLEFNNTQTNNTEVANSEDFIEKAEFLEMHFKGENGKMYFNDVEIESVTIDRNLSGDIV